MSGGGLIVWYHGPVPVDYLGLVARLHLDTGRRVWSVIDRLLASLPLLEMFTTHLRCGAYSKARVAGLLSEGELVGVSPGGARECLFDQNFDISWQNRYHAVWSVQSVQCLSISISRLRQCHS